MIYALHQSKEMKRRASTDIMWCLLSALNSRNTRLSAKVWPAFRLESHQALWCSTETHRQLKTKQSSRTLWLKGESKHEGSWEMLSLLCHPKQGLSAPHANSNSYRLLFITAEERISLLLLAVQWIRVYTRGLKVVSVNLMTATEPLMGF